MAWDFLSSSRDLVGLVLPPAKRMIGALMPPSGKVGFGSRAVVRWCGGAVVPGAWFLFCFVLFCFVLFDIIQ